MRSTFHVYSDPGHGWIKVSLKDVAALDMTPQHFSTYSYRSADHIFLEEDCDASLFISAWRKANPDKTIVFKEHHSNKRSKIRSYYHNA
jgi:hypothetical protein